jgi:hypothetical protein
MFTIRPSRLVLSLLACPPGTGSLRADDGFAAGPSTRFVHSGQDR